MQHSSDQAFQPGLSTLLLTDALPKPVLFSEKSPAPQWALPGPHPIPCSTTGAMQQCCAASTLPPVLVDRQTDWPKCQFGSKPRTSLTAHVTTWFLLWSCKSKALTGTITQVTAKAELNPWLAPTLADQRQSYTKTSSTCSPAPVAQMEAAQHGKDMVASVTPCHSQDLTLSGAERWSQTSSSRAHWVLDVAVANKTKLLGWMITGG